MTQMPNLLASRLLRPKIWTAMISIIRKTLRLPTSRTRATLTGWTVRPEKGTRGSRVRHARIYRTVLLPNLQPDKAQAPGLSLRRCRRPALLQRHLLSQLLLRLQRGCRLFGLLL